MIVFVERALSIMCFVKLAHATCVVLCLAVIKCVRRVVYNMCLAVIMGGKKVPSHPSCFFFAVWSLLLTIYVDDVLLSGPAEHHHGFWRQLEKDVHIEPEEDLSRYLGRMHTFEEKSRLSYDLMESFKSTVA